VLKAEPPAGFQGFVADADQFGVFFSGVLGLWGGLREEGLQSGQRFEVDSVVGAWRHFLTQECDWIVVSCWKVGG
jgi:hypothetical protein